MTNEEFGKMNDNRSRYRHMEFPYSSNYLLKFCEKHHITYIPVCNESDLSPVTFHKMLIGEDKHINCFIRMFSAFESFCKDKDELFTFITGYIQRMMIEVWTYKGMEPSGWMTEVWEMMQIEKGDCMQEKLNKKDEKG